jgi:hypothetical protein
MDRHYVNVWTKFAPDSNYDTDAGVTKIPLVPASFDTQLAMEKDSEGDEASDFSFSMYSNTRQIYRKRDGMNHDSPYL